MDPAQTDMQPLFQRAAELFQAGGWVMWPLLAVSVLSVAITAERAVFWALTHSPRRRRRLRSIASMIRAGELAKASGRASADRSVYGRFLEGLLNQAAKGETLTESRARERAEALRGSIERFDTTHATIVTAAPMLGILGTVTGIIESFRLIGGQQAITDPAQIAGGIAEALFTTAFGLTVALATLFPHALFRAQADACLSRIETLAAGVLEAAGSGRASGAG